MLTPSVSTAGSTWPSRPRTRSRSWSASTAGPWARPDISTSSAHRRAEIGWTWLERAQWGTGANLETKYLLLENAFDRAGLMRVEFKTDARNLRVRGALLGIGATFEGIFRKHMVLPDSIRDSAWYAITDDDWPRVKELLRSKIARHAG